MMWNNDGWWVVMWIAMPLFWVATIMGVMLLRRSSRDTPDGPDDARQILDRRLASGEIDADEHRLLGERLGGSAQASRGDQLWGGLIAPVVVLGLLAMATTAALASGWGGWDRMGWGSMHGSGRDTSGGSVVRGGLTATVTIEDYAFARRNLEVPVGATVTWTNVDAAAHDATSRDGDWKTQRLSGGESETLTFDEPGSYDYYCSIHPSMKARLVVR